MQEFTIDDFAWSNVESISYIAWFNNAPEPYGSISLYLKEHGNEQVYTAIEHLKTLNFVKDASVIYYIPNPFDI